MEQSEIQAFLRAIEGSKYEILYQVTLFTGMRQGEVLGLTWDCVDFEHHMIFVNKQIVTGIGLDHARFHDLRHSYAVVSIESGDDIKTVQMNLGHATASFTLDVYGHVSQKMCRQSADRMEQFIKKVSG